MTEIQLERPGITSEGIRVREYYGTGRSFRRGTEVRELNTRLPEPTIRTINLWYIIEQAKGTCPRFSFLDHYADVVLILYTILQLYRTTGRDSPLSKRPLCQANRSG